MFGASGAMIACCCTLNKCPELVSLDISHNQLVEGSGLEWDAALQQYAERVDCAGVDACIRMLERLRATQKVLSSLCVTDNGIPEPKRAQLRSAVPPPLGLRDAVATGEEGAGAEGTEGKEGGGAGGGVFGLKM